MIKCEIENYETNKDNEDYTYILSLDGTSHQLFNEWLAICQNLCDNDIVSIIEMKHIIDTKYSEFIEKVGENERN